MTRNNAGERGGWTPRSEIVAGGSGYVACFRQRLGEGTYSPRALVTRDSASGTGGYHRLMTRSTLKLPKKAVAASQPGERRPAAARPASKPLIQKPNAHKRPPPK